MVSQAEVVRKVHKSLEDSTGQPERLLDALKEAGNVIWPSEKVLIERMTCAHRILMLVNRADGYTDIGIGRKFYFLLH